MSFYRSYRQLSDMGLLSRFCRGIYVADGFSLVDVNKKINENSYVSFEYVLAEHSMIGSYSDTQIKSII